MMCPFYILSCIKMRSVVQLFTKSVLSPLFSLGPVVKSNKGFLGRGIITYRSFTESNCNTCK